MTTTAPPAGDTPSWLDRHLASLTTDPRRPTPLDQPPPTRRATEDQTEDHDDGQAA